MIIAACIMLVGLAAVAVLSHRSGYRLGGVMVVPLLAVYTFREPLGVVALVTPWNFPIATPSWKLATALATGNTVVFKPSSETPMIAKRLVELLEAAGVPDGVLNLVVGPGSTVGAIKAELGFEPSPIGVDVWRDGEVVLRDGTEREILDALGEENVIVVSPIGGQGFVFGRGNPQLSPAVIRRCDLRIVASRAKLDDVRALRVDTDDPDLDAELSGWVRVRVGKFETRMMKIA